MSNRPSLEVGEPTGWVTTDTAQAELVTDEMLEKAADAYRSASAKGLSVAGLEAALAAVAPMIAARVPACANLNDQLWCRLDEVTRMLEVEREACAQIADDAVATAGSPAGFIAAAIRARGETP